MRKVASARMVNVAACACGAGVCEGACATAGPAASSASTDRLVCPREFTLVIVYAMLGAMLEAVARNAES